MHIHPFGISVRIVGVKSKPSASIAGRIAEVQVILLCHNYCHQESFQPNLSDGNVARFADLLLLTL